MATLVVDTWETKYCPSCEEARLLADVFCSRCATKLLPATGQVVVETAEAAPTPSK